MTHKLVRGLSFIDAFSLVVGTIIGTGIFLKAATMSQLMGSPALVMLAWLVAGFLSMAGALAYAEISGMFPNAGGEYAYLREGYGRFWAYLYGWTRFWVGSPASIAAYAVGAATFLGGLVSLKQFGGTGPVAVFFILVFSLLNCFKVSFGGAIQTVMTLLKIALVLGLAACLFIFSPGSTDNLVPETATAWPGANAFGAAILAALWAFDGWNNLPMVGAEVKAGEKNLPRALVVGILTILAVYLAINIAYFYALPFSEIITANSTKHPEALSVATKAAATFLGSSAVSILSILFVFSAIGAMNGSIMTSARVPFAMASDQLFFPKLAQLHSKTAVPVVAIAVQAVVSSLLALSGTFDQLTDYVVFSSWIFYALVTAALFVFRRKYPDAPRSYRVWGYPYLPAAFLIVSSFLLVNTLQTNPRESGIGLVFIIVGIPFYFLFNKKHQPLRP